MLKRIVPFLFFICIIFLQSGLLNIDSVEAFENLQSMDGFNGQSSPPSVAYEAVAPPVLKIIRETVTKINDGLDDFYLFTTQAHSQGYNIPILMYHAIDEYNGTGIKDLYVTPASFKEQMEYLKSSGFTPITFDNLPYISRYKKPVIITFDDGYKNNLNAYNILKELNDENWRAKGVIFMIGHKINTKNGLSTDEIKEMSDSGIISFQSHTTTHPNLTMTTDFEKELGESKTIIEKITGKEVVAIAYPSGKYDQKVIEETKKYYTYAVTTKPGFANTAGNLYEMNRVRVHYSTSLETFKQLVNP